MALVAFVAICGVRTILLIRVYLEYNTLHTEEQDGFRGSRRGKFKNGIDTHMARIRISCAKEFINFATSDGLGIRLVFVLLNKQRKSTIFTTEHDLLAFYEDHERIY